MNNGHWTHQDLCIHRSVVHTIYLFLCFKNFLRVFLVMDSLFEVFFKCIIYLILDSFLLI